MARGGRKNGGAPLRSMTGFGAASGSSKAVAVEVELKAANSRFLDLIFRLPRVYNQFESEIRAEIAQHVERGRVEVSVNRVPKVAQPVEVRFNRPAFKRLHEVYTSIGKEIGSSKEEVRAAILSQVLSRNEVLEVHEEPVDAAGERVMLLDTVRKALEAFDTMRVKEGRHLESDIRDRIGKLVDVREKIGTIVQRKPEQARDRLLAAVKRLTADAQLDQSRLHTEVALLADKSDVTEELVRLDSHLEHFETLLGTAPVGKKLDFLIQELLREFNTIGSKAQDPEVQVRVVESKSELEKIREQVQNLE